MTSLASSTGARVVQRNVPWETYEALLAARGEEPSPKFTYDGGTLEIMSPSGKHEWVKRLLARFIDIFTLERGIKVRSAGSTTFRDQLREKGLEPGESYYIQKEPLVRFKDDLDLGLDPPPDLAVEIDASTSSINKLDMYRSLGVPEVWSHDESGVVIHALGGSREDAVPPRSPRGEGYERSKESRVLPGLSDSIVNRFLGERTRLDETSLVDAFREWVRGSARAT